MMTRTDIINTIADDIRKQAADFIRDVDYYEVRRCHPATRCYEGETSGCAIHYNVDINGGEIVDGFILDTDGRECPRLTEYLTENFPDLWDDIEGMISDEFENEIEPTYGDLADDWRKE